VADLFSDDDRYTALLARLEALEAAVFPKTARPAKEKAEEELSFAWGKWDRHRHGKGWTADARTLSMRTLRKLAGTDGALALAIVDQSIERGWSGLFPLKADDRQQAPAPKHKSKQEALAPTEDKRTAHLAWCRNQVERGMMTEAEFQAEKGRNGS
jgi:hypothetical protein